VEAVFKEQHMSRITPFLWFDTQAEEAMTFYTSVFRNSRIGSVARYGDSGPGPKGTVMTASFTLDGQDFIALNGGPQFTFTPATSFVVNCETQEEVDYYWDKLSAGGRTDRCGWLTDRFGLSWQVVPRQLSQLLSQGGPAAGRVVQALMQMEKLDIAKLQAAAA
jgi:predicted 3-demethylubiquinone-9 3-methyltransferase (glyoxalase superfamily)